MPPAGKKAASPTRRASASSSASGGRSSATSSSRTTARTAAKATSRSATDTTTATPAKRAKATKRSSTSAPKGKANPRVTASTPAKKAAASTKKAVAKKAAPKPTAKKAAEKAPAKAATKKAAAKKAPAKAESPFDDKFLEAQRQLLGEERTRLVREAESLTAEANALAEGREPGDVQFDEESGEGDTLAVERERDLALSAQFRGQVEEIDHALTKFELGTYGICEVSGTPIPKERLKAIPWARERVEYKVGGFGRR